MKQFITFLFSWGGGSIIANFVPNFVAMVTGVDGRKCNWQHSMAHPQNPPIGAKISYTSWVQANFVPNFVAMATEVGRGKCNWQHSMAHPPKPLYRRKNLPKFFMQAKL